MQETAEIQRIKEIDRTTQDTNQDVDKIFTEISSRKRERTNTLSKNEQGQKKKHIQ